MNKLFNLALCCFLSTAYCSTQQEHWDGEVYVNNSTLQYQWALSYIKKLNLQGTEHILDIGCGDGRITALIAKNVPQGSVVGVDNSSSMLQEAKKHQLKNLEFLYQDAQNLDFREEFDLVTSFSCFHWVPNHLLALKQIEKSLKPGGRVFLYFAPDHGRDRFDYAIKLTMTSDKWSPYFIDFSTPFSLISPSKLTNYAEDAHLLIKRIEIITVDEPFINKSAFMGWISGWMSQLKQLPKELHEQFLDDIISHYLKKHPTDTEGKIHYIDYWIEVELLKP